MKITDAANILNITGEINPDIVKKAFRAAAKKYHPDVNPAGGDMMKVVTAAYDALKDYSGTVDAAQSEFAYPEALNEALNIVLVLDGLIIEVCGAWIWVTGNTFKHKETLKSAGFKYAKKKQAWHFRPEGWKSRGRGVASLDEIRETYGSSRPAPRNNNTLSYTGA